MKKNVWTFGLISGAILALGIFLTTLLNSHSHTDFDHGLYFGYGMMLLAFSLIFAAVKNYRDKFNQGTVSFGKAFMIGLYITLIASSVYVLAWMIDYQFFVPDFMDKYAAHMIENVKASGASAEKINATIASMNDMKALYKNPVIRMLMTYLEVLPVGVLLSLICALLLKKKPQAAGAEKAVS